MKKISKDKNKKIGKFIVFDSSQKNQQKLEYTKNFVLFCYIYHRSNSIDFLVKDFFNRLLFKKSSFTYKEEPEVKAFPTTSKFIFKYFCNDLGLFCSTYKFVNILFIHRLLDANLNLKQLLVRKNYIYSILTNDIKFKHITIINGYERLILPIHIFQGKNVFPHNGCRLRKIRKL